jgi:nucleoid DNA-binding protein
VSTITKKDIDTRFSAGGFRSINVSRLTEQWLHEVMKELVAGNEVYLRGFGTFRVFTRKGKRAAVVSLTRGNGKKGESAGVSIVRVKTKYYVSFKRARAFREMFQERFGKNRTRSADQ